MNKPYSKKLKIFLFIYLMFFSISNFIGCGSSDPKKPEPPYEILDTRTVGITKEFVRSSNGSENAPEELSKGAHEQEDYIVFVGIGEAKTLEEAKEKARNDARKCLATSLKNLTTVETIYNQNYKSKYSYQDYINHVHTKVIGNLEIVSSSFYQEYWKEEKKVSKRPFNEEKDVSYQFTYLSGIRWAKEQFIHALQQL